MKTQISGTHHSIYAFLLLHKVMTIAFTDTAGPGACALWFTPSPDLELFFLSSPRTRHGMALASGGHVAFTIQKDDQSWQCIQGVQGTGYCAPVPDMQMDNAWQTYSARFPFVLQQFGTIAVALASVTLWSVKPTWFRLIDNTKGFGHKDEVTLA